MAEKVLYEDKANQRRLWVEGPEEDRTVMVRMGKVRLALYEDDAEALYQMLGRWREQTPGRGWDDDPLAIRGPQ